MVKQTNWLRVGMLVRAVGIVSAVVIVVTGVAFAALQSQQASLTNNSIQSATADLRVGTSATSFAASRAGFSFNDVVPGGLAVPSTGHTFYLKNFGSSPLKLKISVSDTPLNESNVDLGAVMFSLARAGGSAAQTFSLKALVEAYPTGGLDVADSLGGGTVGEYSLKALMTATAFTGQSASIQAINLVFTGVAL